MTDPAVNVRAAFREVSLGLMSWRDPAEMTPREYRRLELVPDGRTYRPEGKETHYVSADWEERA